ncbi:hypothetical protein HDU76_007799 [Blyttiomyces sp. JEL0837]|nr:hypothetical protein HDU76_007799 [Blyttiomyces sp. JEL0837]
MTSSSAHRSIPAWRVVVALMLLVLQLSAVCLAYRPLFPPKLAPRPKHIQRPAPPPPQGQYNDNDNLATDSYTTTTATTKKNVARRSYRFIDQPEVEVGAALGGLNLQPLHGRNRGYNDEEKMEFLRNMARYSWQGYKKYAWGWDELMPISKKGFNWYDTSLATSAVDGMATLLIMGLYEEYEEAKELALTIDFTKIKSRINVFETSIRILGGLVTAYDLDGDERLLAKAVELADLFLPAFDTENGFPLNVLNFTSGVAMDNGMKFSTVIFAEIGTFSLEFQYLTDVTGNKIYAEKAMYVIEQIFSFKNKVPGLFPYILSTTTHKFPSGEALYGIGALGDSTYEYLMKIWLATGEERYLDYYTQTADASVDYIARLSANGKNMYTPNAILKGFTLDKKPIFNQETTMQHLACFAGGMFTMGAIASRKGRWTEQLNVGQRVTQTCFDLYNSTATGIGPEVGSGESLKPLVNYFILRPEVIESIFYMWRISHDPKWREQGWQIAKAIEKYCKSENGGYFGLWNVDSVNGDKVDKMESFFIAETLKYLYLLFTDDDTIALERYVLTTEAHPISVRGHGSRRDPKSFIPLPLDAKDFARPIGKLVEISPELKARRARELEIESLRSGEVGIAAGAGGARELGRHRGYFEKALEVGDGDGGRLSFQ